VSRRRKPPSRRPGSRSRPHGRRAPSGDHASDLFIYQNPPPFKGYAEWFRVPDAGQHVEHPATHDHRLSDGAKDLVKALVRLAPRYGNMVPLAAIYLQERISSGVVHLALTADDYRPVDIAEMAGEMSSPEKRAEVRARYPEADLPSSPGLVTPDAAAFHLHELHASGAVVLDDNHILNLAAFVDGRWLLSGRDDSLQM
jgi:hypothetical protein